MTAVTLPAEPVVPRPAVPSHPLVRGTRPLLISVLWLAFSLLQAVTLLVASPAPGRNGALLILHGTLGLTWAGLTFAVGLWILPEDDGGAPWPRQLAYHICAVLICGLVDTLVRRTATAMLGGSFVIPWYGTLLYFADRTLVGYLAIVLLTRTLAAHDRFIARQRVALALQAQLARARLASLEEQLHPHFLFNCLGAVSELAHEAPARASRMLRQLASVVRFAIERQGTEVTVAEELAALDSYLEVQRTRFSDWLTIETRIGAGAADLLMPPLVLQPLVENAIRHGLVRRDLPGEIVVSATERDGSLVLEVRDNGVGLRGGHLSGRGIGTANLRDRLAALYADAGELALYEDASGGVVARVRIPSHRRLPVVEAPTSTARNDDIPLWTAFRRWPTAGIVLAWTTWSVLWTQQSMAYLAFRGRLGQRSFLDIAGQDFLLSMIWAALTPLMLLMVRIVPLTGRGLAVRIGAHGLAAIAISTIHGFFTRRLLGSALVASESVAAAAWGILAYGVVLGVAHHGRIRGWLRERDLADERMRVTISEAELEATYSRARPQQLLDRLESIAQSIQADASGAERQLARLGDELREALDRRVTA
jgi:hypothetical protein